MATKESTLRLAQRVRNAQFTGLIGQNGQTLMRLAMDLQNIGYQADVQVVRCGLQLPMRFFHEFVQDDQPVEEGPLIAFSAFPESQIAADHAVFIRDALGDACVDTWEEWGEVLGSYRRAMVPVQRQYNRWLMAGPVKDENAARRNLGAQLFCLIEQEYGLKAAYELMGLMVDRFSIAELVGMLEDRQGLAERVREIVA